MEFKGIVPSRSRGTRVLVLSLGLAAAEATILALGSLILPPYWMGTGVASIGVLGGGMCAILVYGAWGSASCLADINVWAMALLAGLGSSALQSIACSVMAKFVSVGFIDRVPTTCASSNRRVATEVGTMSVLFVTLIVWAVVRYSTWKLYRHRG